MQDFLMCVRYYYKIKDSIYSLIQSKVPTRKISTYALTTSLYGCKMLSSGYVIYYIQLKPVQVCIILYTRIPHPGDDWTWLLFIFDEWTTWYHGDIYIYIYINCSHHWWVVESNYRLDNKHRWVNQVSLSIAGATTARLWNLWLSIELNNSRTCWWFVIANELVIVNYYVQWLPGGR